MHRCGHAFLPSYLLLGIALGVVSVACSPDGRAAGLGGERGAGGGRGGAGAAVPVTTAKVFEKSLPVTVTAIGTVEPYSTVDIRAQITGQLTNIHFTEGQVVSEGQPLFTIDPRPFEATLRQAEAILARDKAQAENAKAEVVRNADLVKRGLIPRNQYDALETTSSALQATLGADQAQVDTARLQLQYTRITAPVSGRTGALGVHQGDLIRANDTTPLVVINQVAPIYVSFAIPSRLLSDVRKYQAAGTLRLEAKAADASAESSVGSVTFIDNAVDTTTGTIRLKGTFPNRDLQLWPGLFVDVLMRLTVQARAVVVTTEAIQTGQQGQFVYFVKPDQTVETRPVTIARAEGGESVIASGLKPGDEVVTDGLLRLTPGVKITTKQPGAAAEKTPAAGETRQAR